MIVGITGSIGSGKSTVCRYLQQLGYDVLSADDISHELMDVGQKGYRAVVDTFSLDIVSLNGRIDKQKLAVLIFSDPIKKQQLEHLLHPMIYEELLLRSKNLKSTLVFWEIPLLFESGFERYCDKTWSIVGEEETLIRRAMLRSNMKREDVLSRLSTQLSQEEKQKRADFVIFNESSLENLYARIGEVLQQMTPL